MAYFDHDSDAATDDKILELRARFGVAGYGLWWLICETLSKGRTIDTKLLGGLSLGYGVATSTLKEVIDFCVEIGLLVENEDGNLHNERMTRHVNKMLMYTEAGKKGAEKRWKNRGAIDVANSTPNADKIREEKNREEKNTLPEVSGDTAPVDLFEQPAIKPKQHFTEAQIEQLYKLYPRQTAKKAALKAISKALEELRTKPRQIAAYLETYHGLTPTEAKEWADDPFRFAKFQVEEFARVWAGQPPEERQFIPYPASFFNAGRLFDASYDRKEAV